MDDELDAGTALDDGQPGLGTEFDEGQPAESSDPSGGQPESGQELPEQFGNDPEKLLKSYQEIQSKYSKTAEELKQFKERSTRYDDQFSGFGGAERAQQILTALYSNPKALQAAASELQGQGQAQNDQLYGLDASQFGDEEKTAVELVGKIAQQIADQQTAPIRSQLTKIVADNSMAQMDAKYPGWRDVQGEMRKIAATLPPNIANNPSFELFENLYGAAVIRSGKHVEMGKQEYLKSLEAKKQKSSERPAHSPAGKPKANSVMEALELSAKQLGMRLPD